MWKSEVNQVLWNDEIYIRFILTYKGHLKCLKYKELQNRLQEDDNLTKAALVSS